MKLELHGKSALVTAATYGLGYAIAEALAGENVRLVICSRDEDRVKEAASKLSSVSGSEVTGLRADLTNSADLNTLVAETKRTIGNPDILVLNTGHPPTYPLMETDDEKWQRGIDLILKPTIKLTQAFLPEMRKKKYGRLIYIGSIFGLEAERSSIIQSTLRTGLNGFAKCVATEAAIDGVTANVICPGYFHTPLAVDLAGKYAREKGVATDVVVEEWKNLAPARKFGKPEDLGALVSFLASPRGEFVNGTALTIDGGLIKQY